jgi:tRNA(Arg) A34 adenosine deaminase TadA
VERLTEQDASMLRSALEAATSARAKGNHPFGAVLADREGEIVLKAENTVITDGEATAHAETNLIRQASKQFSREEMERLTLYASSEPCPMCSGAIYWGGVGRVVYGLSQEEMYASVGAENRSGAFILHCRDVLAAGARHVEVIGPALEDEAVSVHEGYWSTS